MIEAGEFLAAARARGFDFFTGVPCSFLTPLINRVVSDPDTPYVAAASEGEAVAIAAGAWLAGRMPVVMCQNSGLGNAVNPLTSLCHPFRIPVLLVVTWRGGPGVADEPQHELMGRITPELLDVMGIGHEAFPAASSEVGPVLERAVAAMGEKALPRALVMEKGAVRPEPLQATAFSAREQGEITDLRERQPGGGAGGMRRIDALAVLQRCVPSDAGVIATTGKAGRELFTLEDRDQQLYQVGSMGCAAGMGLGVALTSGRPVFVADGDGALLMKLGTLATVGAYRPERFVHVVLDNACHDSTGGQPTVSPVVDFPGAAIACGYRRAWRCDSGEGLAAALEEGARAPGPHLVHVALAPGSIDRLGRPSVPPEQVARRFRAFLAGKGREAGAQ